VIRQPGHRLASSVDMDPSVPAETLTSSDLWFFDPEKWPIYRTIIEAASSRGVPFAVGGGFANMAYTGIPRHTKDVDLFILPRDRDAMIEITAKCGLHDYYAEKPYDRAWIYRATADDLIVDLIWAMANHRSPVDQAWIDHSPEITVKGVRFRIMAAEELLWNKLYIMQRDRCDWPDALNLIYARASTLDWRYLLGRLGEDVSLLSALVSLFSWICPERTCELPRWLWTELGIHPPETANPSRICEQRAAFLDTRPWFLPTLDNDRKEVRCKSAQ
jgi:hypothetical protein